MPSSMTQLCKKTTSAITALLVSVCVALSSSPTAQAQTFSPPAQGTGGTGNDGAGAIAADAAGNSYVTGYFSDTVTFGPGQTRTALGGTDIFVAKYNSAGTLLWVQQAGGPDDDDDGSSITVDGSGNIYIAGTNWSVSTSFFLSPTPGGSATLISGGGFVAKYNSAGTLQWVKSITSTNPFAIAVNSATDISIACSATDVVGLLNPADASFALTTSVPAATETAAATTGPRSVCDSSSNCATAGPIGPIKIDKKPPSVAIAAPVNNATYALNQAVTANFSCTDAGAGVANCTGSIAHGANIDTGSVTAKSFTVSATDAVGNTTAATVNYDVIASVLLCYGAPGHAILSPIASDGSSVFKQGATVPAKFRLCDAAGNSIGTAGVVSKFRLTQVISGSTVENVDVEVPSATPHTEFRWDPLERQWVFNISTSSFVSGRTYVFRISLSDGTDIGFGFGLK